MRIMAVICSGVGARDQGCAGRSFFQQGRAGRGEDENPRGGAGWGGAKMKIRGAVRGGAGRKSA